MYDAGPRLSLVIPGFGGNAERAKVIERNIVRFRNMALQLVQCNVFLYEKNASSRFWDHSIMRNNATLQTAYGLLPEAARSGCIMRPNGAGSFLYHTATHSIDKPADFVLMLLDSVEMDDNVDLNRLARVMLANCLGLASPACPTCPTKQLLKPNPSYNSTSVAGRLVEYVDAQAYLMTPTVFECWKVLINLTAAPNRASREETRLVRIDKAGGWSMIRYFAPMCGFRQGIVDSMTMQKRMSSVTGSKAVSSYSWIDAARDAKKGEQLILRQMPHLRGTRGNSSKILEPLCAPAPAPSRAGGSDAAPPSRAWAFDHACAARPIPGRHGNRTHPMPHLAHSDAHGHATVSEQSSRARLISSGTEDTAGRKLAASVQPHFQPFYPRSWCVRTSHVRSAQQHGAGSDTAV